jgi:hypothetical protein
MIAICSMMQHRMGGSAAGTALESVRVSAAHIFDGGFCEVGG